MDKLLDERANLFATYLGQELKGVIRSHGYTQGDVADGTGHSRPSLSNWLNNKPSIPIEVAEKVCNYIGVDLADAVSRADHRVGEELGPWPPVELDEEALREERIKAAVNAKIAKGMGMAASHDPDKDISGGVDEEFA